MRKLLLVLSLATLLFACEQQLDPAPNANPEQILSTTDGAVADLVIGERVIPTKGISAIASGPEAVPAGTKQSINSENAISSIGFEPNAGVIWFDGKNTHLMALQLPGGGESAVKRASLGTGWGGATHLAMDRYNFYVVWMNEIYKVPKSLPNTWTVVVPNNGKTITGIVGFADGHVGFNFSRTDGSQISYYQNYDLGAIRYFDYFICAGCVKVESNVWGLAQYKDNTGRYRLMGMNPNNFSYYLYAHGDVNQYNNINCDQYWAPSDGNRPTSGAGNPMTESFFYSKPSVLLGSPQIFEFKFSLGPVTTPFSYIRYTPATAPLVVNNGYVWIMGDVLQRLVTFGPNRGKSAYNEYGWGGIKLACADPTLVF
jgi:prepilin-type processing-associated H-X9-DG protein